MKAKSKAALDRVRRICLALPDATEKLAWGSPTFRVRDRIFVMFGDNHHGDGRIAIWCNAAEGAQRDLVAADPEHIFVPAYVGKSGWIGVRLDRGLPWPAVSSLIEEAYRVTAAKRRKKEAVHAKRG